MKLGLRTSVAVVFLDSLLRTENWNWELTSENLELRTGNWKLKPKSWELRIVHWRAQQLNDTMTHNIIEWSWFTQLIYKADCVKITFLCLFQFFSDGSFGWTSRHIELLLAAVNTKINKELLVSVFFYFFTKNQTLMNLYFKLKYLKLKTLIKIIRKVLISSNAYWGKYFVWFGIFFQ